MKSKQLRLIYKTFGILILMGLFASCSSSENNNPVSIEDADIHKIQNIISTNNQAMPETEIVDTTIEPSEIVIEIKEIEKELQKLNNYCRFPCFWGFIPGESSIEEYELFIANHGLNIGTFDRENGIKLYASGFSVGEPLHSTSGIEIYEHNESGIIQWIHFRIDKLRESSDISVSFEHILPASVFEEYGVPSRIILGIGTPTEITQNISYGMDLYYDELGFFVSYRGYTENSEVLNLCFSNLDIPTFPKEIHIYLKPISDPSTLEFVTSTIHESRIYVPSIKTFTEITSMEFDEFVALFNGDNPEVCFEVDRDQILYE